MTKKKKKHTNNNNNKNLATFKTKLLEKNSKSCEVPNTLCVPIVRYVLKRSQNYVTL